jgi:hypothetical protein
MSEPDNLVLAHLRELRTDMNRRFDEIEARFAEMNQRFTALDTRLDRMHANGMMALRSFIGHRNIFERTMASVGDDISDLRQRVTRLEAAAAR